MFIISEVYFLCNSFLFFFLLLTEMDDYGLQLLVNQLEPLTEQQLLGIGNLQQSSQQAEDALSQGMEALQQSLAETLSSGSLGSSGSSGNVANYMGQMAMAMGKLGTLEGFIRQVPLLNSWFSFQRIRLKSWVIFFSLYYQPEKKWMYFGTNLRLLSLAFMTIIFWLLRKGIFISISNSLKFKMFRWAKMQIF